MRSVNPPTHRHGVKIHGFGRVLPGSVGVSASGYKSIRETKVIYIDSGLFVYNVNGNGFRDHAGAGRCIASDYMLTISLHIVDHSTDYNL